MKPEDRNEDEYLRETAPFLFAQKRKAADEPPPGYLSAFAAKMQDRIARDFPGKGPTQAKVRYINFRNFAAAAAVLLLIAGIGTVQYLGSGAESGVTFVAYTDEEAEFLIELYGEAWYDELGYADEEPLLFAAHDPFADIDPGALEHYLAETDIPYDVLIDELNTSQE